MKKINFALAIVLSALVLTISSCKDEYYGTWKGRFNDDEEFLLRIKRDGTFSFESYELTRHQKSIWTYKGKWTEGNKDTYLILDPEEQYFGHIAYSDGVPPKTSDFEYVCLNLEIVNPKEANLIILDKYCKGRSYICNFNSPDY